MFRSILIIFRKQLPEDDEIDRNTSEFSLIVYKNIILTLVHLLVLLYEFHILLWVDIAIQYILAALYKTDQWHQRFKRTTTSVMEASFSIWNWKTCPLPTLYNKHKIQWPSCPYLFQTNFIHWNSHNFLSRRTRRPWLNCRLMQYVTIVWKSYVVC
jgi:hypothetical protein